MTAGKDFENRIRKRLEQSGCYVHKLPDASTPFIDRPKLGQTAARFAPRNPFDFIVLRPVGRLFRAYAVECKSTALPRFALSTVKPHQVDGLARFPGSSGVLIEIRSVRRSFFVDVVIVAGWIKRTGRKSMALADLEAEAIELPRNTTGRERKTYYDVGPLLAMG